MKRTYGEYKIEGSNLAIHLEAQAAARFKRIFTKIDKAPRYWIEAHLTPETASEFLWFMDRYPLTASDSDHRRVEQLAREFDAKMELVAKLTAPDYEPHPVELALPPRHYQLLPAEMTMATGGLLLIDDVGLGKTVTSIVLLSKPGTLPAVVVSLTAIPPQFEREIKRFAPSLKTYIIQKSEPYHKGKVPQDLAARWLGIPKYKSTQRQAKEPPFERPDVVLISYSKIAGWAQWLVENLQPVTFIIDEAQEARRGVGTDDKPILKNAAIQYISEHVRYRLGLSATPIHNEGAEIFPVMECILPGVLGPRDEFIREWCNADQMKNPAALGTYLREIGVVLSRTKADVGRELPALSICEHFCDCDAASITALRQSTRAIELAKSVLASTRRSFQDAGQFDLLMRQTTGIAKAPFVAAFVDVLLQSGEPIVLYAWHHAVYDLWAELLKEHKPVFFTGRQSGEEKQDAVRRFRNGDTKLFIISLRAGAGLDGLQYAGCSNVVFGELDWSPAVHEQAIGRVCRDGIDRPVTAWFLVADEGSDPAMAEILGVKRGQLEGIRDPEGKVVIGKLDQQALKRLARQFLLGQGIEATPATPEPAPNAWRSAARDPDLFGLLEKIDAG